MSEWWNRLLPICSVCDTRVDRVEIESARPVHGILLRYVCHGVEAIRRVGWEEFETLRRPELALPDRILMESTRHPKDSTKAPRNDAQPRYRPR